MKILRVLLVEDEPAVSAAMLLVLEALGHAPKSCLDSEGCKAHLKGANFDLMILDLNLGTNADDGVKLVQEIRSLRLPLPPMIILSAQPVNELAAAAKAIGARSYLRKPCTSKELRAAMMCAVAA